MMFSARVRSGRYLLPLGLAQARMEVRALSWLTRPALATDTVCCSMTWGGGWDGWVGGMGGGGGRTGARGTAT